MPRVVACDPRAVHVDLARVEQDWHSPRVDVRSTLARWLRGATNLGLAVAARLASRRSNESPRVVLIHRVGRLGDGAAAWPALRVLRQRFPDAHLILWTSAGENDSPGIAELASGWVDEVRRYRPADLRARPRAHCQELRELSIDRWQALPQVGTAPWTELRNLAFARAAGARQLGGFSVGGMRWLSRALDRGLAPALPETARLLSLLDAADDGALFDVEADERASDALVIAPGAARAANRWPIDRFREVAARELERGGRVVIVGGQADRSLARELAESPALGHGFARLLDLTGATDVQGTLAILVAARAVVANDSGVAHLAGLVGRRTVVVSSARDVAGRWHARGAHVLREDPACGPCWQDDCPLDHRCLLDIPASRVLALLDQIAPLGAGSSTSMVDKRPPLGSPSRQ